MKLFEGDISDMCIARVDGWTIKSVKHAQTGSEEPNWQEPKFVIIHSSFFLARVFEIHKIIIAHKKLS